MTFTHYDSDTRLFSTKEGTASPPHSLSIMIRVKPWVIVIRVKQWLEKRLASIYILGLQSEAVYGHVVTQFSWMGRLPHFLSYGVLKRRAWSSMHSISFMCIHVPFQKKKDEGQTDSEVNTTMNVNSASTIILINAPYP